MCGIFGRHKNHKITTDGELKEMNFRLIEQNKGGLKELVDFKILRKNESFKEYVESVTKSAQERYKERVLEEGEVG